MGHVEQDHRTSLVSGQFDPLLRLEAALTEGRLGILGRLAVEVASMLARYIAKRFGLGILQLIGLVFGVFFIIRLLPADPVARLVGMNASPQAYAQAAHQLGLDRPLLTQLAIYLGVEPSVQPGLLQGSLGASWVTDSPVISEIAQYLPVTITLVTLSFLL